MYAFDRADLESEFTHFLLEQINIDVEDAQSLAEKLVELLIFKFQLEVE